MSLSANKYRVLILCINPYIRIEFQDYLRSLLGDYIDFDALGNQISEDREGQFVEGGFVCMDSGCSLELILEDEENLMMRGM